MGTTTVLSLAALLALLPGAVLPYRATGTRPALFWWLLAAALAAMLVWVAVEFSAGWRTGFAAALWVSVSVALLAFAVVAALDDESWRLSALLHPYLFILGLVATIWLNQPERPMAPSGAAVWIDLHIVFAVTTYALFTVAAVAGCAAFIQERALKSRRPGRLSRVLPPLAASERLELRLLWIVAVVLACGLATGMALEFFERGRLLVGDHKTVLSLAAFAVIVALLAARWISGMRGRAAARIVLIAYLLLTLAYPGVKFVTDVLLV